MGVLSNISRQKVIFCTHCLPSVFLFCHLQAIRIGISAADQEDAVHEINTSNKIDVGNHRIGYGQGVALCSDVFRQFGTEKMDVVVDFYLP